ncbi:2-hydroxyacid dehydrogenase [Microvirga sp. W0021]|uniref:2-hydroxyacid dehydrogenase n=1 Tax=Hohaiivirga grylli TaxID=3133970 RepID=A0ABV0BI05_9HYPH
MSNVKVAVFNTKSYDRAYLEKANRDSHKLNLEFFDFPLTSKTAKLADGFQAACIFVNDEANRASLEGLAKSGVKVVALRNAGFNNVDLQAAKDLGITVVRVPAYSPEAVAEHAVGLMLCLNRKIHKAYQRTREANFSLEGLTGFNMFKRTVGVVGTGKIGIATIRILKGFGMDILAYDPYPSHAVVELGVSYVPLDELYARSDVITLHCPATPENYHLLSKKSFDKMKDGVMIINTSRGSLLDSFAAMDALQRGRIGALGLDVYENERDLFFEDKSNDMIHDDVFQRLSSCHNVIFTGHQAFLTEEALTNIAETTIDNIHMVTSGQNCPNEVSL